MICDKYPLAVAMLLEYGINPIVGEEGMRLHPDNPSGDETDFTTPTIFLVRGYPARLVYNTTGGGPSSVSCKETTVGDIDELGTLIQVAMGMLDLYARELLEISDAHREGRVRPQRGVPISIYCYGEWTDCVPDWMQQYIIKQKAQ